MENNKILTADEMYDKFDSKINPKWDEWDIEEIQNYAKEFAKQHVEKALKNCLEKYHHSIEENYNFGSSEIMNAYDLNNIK